ncbi:cation:proton antiporter [Chlorogloeopsis fritschii PCC 9212]|uniref:Sodium:proton antiporter n=1 Tax=Chlorogloeopsis fritschii PCC 6912 TaxID=211165 RepID=A0A3S0YFC2_CHLFR|nr:cation:proton antiporter [Chlorogloeopsis fritschii]MBF2009587.1 cation:proton antiporter [Chlorogloeopsis fritschii C42_A2020_084]RUR83453.1 sodium:proton antiporter [Chlorogloeopsis fritschii PCC 6912]
MNIELQLLNLREINLTQQLVFAPVFAQIFQPITDPVAIFLIILAIMLVTPLLFERFKLPGIIGLILAGIIVGPYGLGLLERDKTIELLGTVGLLFLMFLGGLETSLDDLKRNANKALTFGLATFVIPMVLGTAAMLPLGYSFLASVLVASCFASHTLLALPVLSKLGIMRNQVVTATLGGTLITNVLALLVLAIVVKANQGNLTLGFWLFLIPSLAIYTFATLWGVPNLGRWFFRRFGHDEGAEFLFVLAALFIVSYLAKLIEIEPIVGAFLAGVAITQLIPQMSPLMNRIQFIGNTLFVPFFLISVGMLVNPLILVKDARGILVAVVMIGAEFASKFLAAWGTAKVFKWKMPSTMVMFGLSVAQAASTLAAITVAFNIKLVDELTVNGIIAMILVSCIASPWIVERWGGKIQQETAHAANSKTEDLEHSATLSNLANRVLVPVANPSTEDNLLNLAIILTKEGNGTLLPLHVIISDKHGSVGVTAKTQQKRLLDTAETLAHAAVTRVEPIGRIDDSIDLGILRAAQERDASLVICGWKGYSTYRENFFGGVIDNIVRRSTAPVLITRFAQPIENTQRVLLAITDYRVSAATLRQTLSLAKILSEALKAPLQVLQVLSEPVQYIPNLESMVGDTEIPIQKIRGNSVRKISELLKANDLLVLLESTHRFGQPALGREPEAIARANPETSITIVHFPERSGTPES